MKRDKRNARPIHFPCVGLVPLLRCTFPKPCGRCWYCSQAVTRG